MWNLLIGVKEFAEVPLSQAYGLPAPLKGSLCTKVLVALVFAVFTNVFPVFFFLKETLIKSSH